MKWYAQAIHNSTRLRLNTKDIFLRSSSSSSPLTHSLHTNNISTGFLETEVILCFSLAPHAIWDGHTTCSAPQREPTRAWRDYWRCATRVFSLKTKPNPAKAARAARGPSLSAADGACIRARPAVLKCCWLWVWMRWCITGETDLIKRDEWSDVALHAKTEQDGLRSHAGITRVRLQAIDLKQRLVRSRLNRNSVRKQHLKPLRWHKNDCER